MKHSELNKVFFFRYWKNMYGYRLVEDENQAPMVYYNVKFFRNATLLTYPEWTVRYYFYTHNKQYILCQ